MSWLDALLRRGPALDAERAAALARYRAGGRPDTRAVFNSQRLVVVDVESSGLNPFRDRLISIGAVALRGGVVRFDDSFDVVLRQPRVSDQRNILVHGITGTAQLAGQEPAAALVDFLAFAGSSPLVGFHADFDRVLIERGTRAALRMKPGNVWIDLARLGPALFPSRAVLRDLDGWLAVFGIENFLRHDALADALATAQLALALFAEAMRQRSGTLADLIELEQAQRWLSHAPRI